MQQIAKVYALFEEGEDIEDSLPPLIREQILSDIDWLFDGDGLPRTTKLDIKQADYLVG
jgi:hypothetical protein